MKEIKEMSITELKGYKIALLEQIKILKEKQNEFIEAYRKYKDLDYKINNLNFKLSKTQKEFQNRCNHTNATVLSTYTTDYEGRTYCVIKCPNCGLQWEDRVCCGNLPYPKDKNFKRDDTRYA